MVGNGSNLARFCVIRLPVSYPQFLSHGYCFLAQLLNCVQYGLLLFLIASGLTLIYAVKGHINHAHGSLFMVGAYTAFVVTSATGSLWIALPAGIVGGFVLGLLLERLLFR